MAELKQITRISFRREPERGERGAVPRMRSWMPGERYLSGAAGEMYLDMVHYRGLYYRCARTHDASERTPYDSVQAADGLWEVESSFEVVATKVAFVGSGSEGWIIDGGVIYHTSGLISLAADGSIAAANGRFRVDNTGRLVCCEAHVSDSTLTNVLVKGSLRSPFVAYDGSWSWNDDQTPTGAGAHDNLTMPGGGGLILAADFPWTADQNGRTVTIVNYKFNGQTTSGFMSLEAPSGMFFFEDGLLKSELRLSREYVVLKGYGEGERFYGWIVIHRGNIGTQSSYGRELKVLAQGIVTGTDAGATLKGKVFDGSALTVSRVGVGRYRIGFPAEWKLVPGSYLVMATGYGYVLGSTEHPIKASVNELSAASFIVETSDDDSRNDGSFFFQIINLNDWS